MTKREKILTLIFLIIVGFVIYYFLTIKKFGISIVSDKLKTINTSKEKLSEKASSISDSKTISLQQVNNVGYSFYIGQIDYPDAPPISDDVKNKITQVIYKANFPKNLLKNVGIIIVNTLAVSEYQYIKTPYGKINIPSFNPEFMTGGGIYSGNFGQMSLIFINKTKLNSLSEILTHELGHFIASQLTNEEWNKYYQLRRIPSNTPRYTQDWRLSPQEDFAEVYKNIFTGSKVRTYYGLLVKNNYLYFEDACGKIYDKLIENYKKAKYPNAESWEMPLFITEEEANITPDAELQNCRREVLLHPEKYPKDWESSELIGPPYYSTVDQATKDFILGIINRLK
jgi:hypothetical protein